MPICGGARFELRGAGSGALHVDIGRRPRADTVVGPESVGVGGTGAGGCGGCAAVGGGGGACTELTVKRASVAVAATAFCG